MRGETESDERGDAPADRAGVDDRPVAADDTGLLEGTYASQAGRGRQADAVAQLLIGESSVLLQLPALSARGVGQSSLTVVDSALLRFGTPLVLLIPLLPKAFRALRRERTTVVALLLAGGLPHFLLFAFGAQLTTAALTGTLVPGTVPLFVAALTYARTRRRLSASRVGALTAISTGVVLCAVLAGGAATLGGVAILVTGGFVWAVYTFGLQRTRLTPMELLVVVCAGSIAAVGGVASPVLTAVVAVPLFGEELSGGMVVALMLIAVDVLASTCPGRYT